MCLITVGLTCALERSPGCQIPPNLVVGRVRRIPIPSRGEDLQIEHPV